MITKRCVLSCCPIQLIADLRGPKGTPAFMAVEVQDSKYMFHKPKESDDSDGDSSGKDQSPAPEDLSAPDLSAQLANATPFFHNYLHDIEAIWWIMMWNLFSTVPGTTSLTLDEYYRRISYEEKLFPASLEGNKTRSFLVACPDDYTEHQHHLCQEYQELGNLMGRALGRLRKLYMKVERPLENALNHESYRGAHYRMRRVFEEARKYGLAQVKYLDQVEKELDEKAAALSGHSSTLKRCGSIMTDGDRPSKVSKFGQGRR